MPWQKGQSGNPKGRPPKVKCIPDILRKIAEEEGTSDGRYTKIEVIMRKVFEFALEGRPWAVQFIAERTEGKVPDKHEISGRDAAPIGMKVVLDNGKDS